MRSLVHKTLSEFGVSAFKRRPYPVIVRDSGIERVEDFSNLATPHGVSDLKDPKFRAALEFGISQKPGGKEDPPTRLRIYHAIKLAEVSLRAKGGIAFLGVAYGVGTHAVLKYLGSQIGTRPVWLVDPWDGASKRGDNRSHDHYVEDISHVENSFSYCPTANFVQGYIPDALGSIQGPLAFIDFHTGDLESEARSIYQCYQLLSPGGAIFLPGYHRHDEHRRAFDEAFKGLDGVTLNLFSGAAAFFKA